TRTYAHPAMPSLRWRWTKPEDTAWRPIQRVDQQRLSVEEWVDQAWTQGALQPLLQDQEVSLPVESVVRDTKYQIAREATEMAKLVESSTGYQSEPMSRAACDLYVPCVFQPVCHSPVQIDLSQNPLYLSRKTSYSTIPRVPRVHQEEVPVQ